MPRYLLRFDVVLVEKEAIDTRWTDDRLFHDCTLYTPFFLRVPERKPKHI